MVVTGTLSAGMVSLIGLVLLLFQSLMPLEVVAPRVPGIVIVALAAAVVAVAIFKHNRVIPVVGLIGAMWLWWEYFQHGAGAGLWVVSGLLVGIGVGVFGVFRLHIEAHRQAPTKGEGV